MHIYFGTRGIKHDVDRFINELSAKYLPFKWKAKGDKKAQDVTLQVRVCPIQLWDVSFPKEHEEAMLNHIFPLGTPNSMTGKLNKFLAIARMGLGLKKIDDFRPSGKNLGILKPQNIDLFAIGKKPDAMIKDKDGDYEGI